MIAALILLMGEREPITIELCPMIGTLVVPALLVFGLVRSLRRRGTT